MVFWALALVALIGLVLVVWTRGEAGKFFLFAPLVLFAFTSLGVWVDQIWRPTEAYSEVQETCRIDLVAMGSGNSMEVSGYFGLFGGSIEGEGFQTITYAVRDADGAVHLKQEDARSSRIFEDSEDGTGTLVCTGEKTYYDARFIWPWSDEVYLGYSTGDFEFHVPPGSVVSSYEVNL